MTNVPFLLTFDQVAKASGFSKNALRKVARDNGLIIQCGRISKIKVNEVEELFEKSRVGKKERASLSGAEKGETLSGSSKTPVDSSVRPAQAAAQRLKKRSQSTSQQNPAQVVQLKRQTS